MTRHIKLITKTILEKKNDAQKCMTYKIGRHFSILDDMWYAWQCNYHQHNNIQTQAKWKNLAGFHGNLKLQPKIKNKWNKK